jgi:hypothetical protein
MGPIDLYVGEPNGDNIRIRIVRRTEQVVRDYWDANWLVSVIAIRAGGWRGKNEQAYFRTEELSRLKAKVELLAEGKLLDAEFMPMEPHLQLKLRAEEPGGPISVSGIATDRLEDGNRLSFAISISPACLPALAERLALVEKSYPTIGKP